VTYVYRFIMWWDFRSIVSMQCAMYGGWRRNSTADGVGLAMGVADPSLVGPRLLLFCSGRLQNSAPTDRLCSSANFVDADYVRCSDIDVLLLEWGFVYLQQCLPGILVFQVSHRIWLWFVRTYFLMCWSLSLLGVSSDKRNTMSRDNTMIERFDRPRFTVVAYDLRRRNQVG